MFDNHMIHLQSVSIWRTDKVIIQEYITHATCKVVLGWYINNIESCQIFLSISYSHTSFSQFCSATYRDVSSFFFFIYICWNIWNRIRMLSTHHKQWSFKEYKILRTARIFQPVWAMSEIKLEPFFNDEEYEVSEVLSFVTL